MSFRIGSFVAAAISEAQESRDLPKSGARRGRVEGPRRDHGDPIAQPFQNSDFARRPGGAKLAIVAEPREN